MVDWDKYKTRRALKYVEHAAREGLVSLEPQKPLPPFKVPRWSLVFDSIDKRQTGCVSVRLPRWASMVFLWFVLPRKTFRELRAALRPREGKKDA